MGKRRTNKQGAELPPVGSKVRMRFGASEVIATVTEHRGPLGVGGRHLLRVSFDFGGADEPIDTEVPLEDVTPVGSAA